MHGENCAIRTSRLKAAAGEVEAATSEFAQINYEENAEYHWSECGRAAPVAYANAVGHPHRSVLAFGFMTLPGIPSQYTLSVARSDWALLLADWRSLLPEGFAPWLLTKFGELLVSQPDGKIGMLQVSSFKYAVVAKDQTDFREWLVDPDKMSEWFLAPLIDRLEAAGRLLGAQQCYSFVQALGLGGALSVENITVLPIENHFYGWGKVFRKIGSLPPGTEVVARRA